MPTWPAKRPADTLAIPDAAERHALEVVLDQVGQVADVRLDGASIWPTWFKLEWKGDGQLSAKAGGVRLSTRGGDTITVLVAPPAVQPTDGPEPATAPLDTPAAPALTDTPAPAGGADAPAVGPSDSEE